MKGVIFYCIVYMLYSKREVVLVDIIVAREVWYDAEQIRKSAIFTNWSKRLPDNWQGSVKILDVGWGGEIHVISMEVRHASKRWPVKVLLRSATVDVLIRIKSPRTDHVVFVAQEREAVPGLVLSNVAGGIDGNEEPEQAARREASEELNLSDISVDYELELTRLVSAPLLASPGIINEEVHFFMATLTVALADIGEILESLEGKRTGISAEGEDLLLKVMFSSEAKEFILSQPNPCAKTLLSLMAAGL